MKPERVEGVNGGDGLFERFWVVVICRDYISGPLGR